LVRGLATVLFGLIAFVRPGAGALSVIGLIATYALFVGGILMLLAFRVRGWKTAREIAREARSKIV